MFEYWRAAWYSEGLKKLIIRTYIKKYAFSLFIPTQDRRREEKRTRYYNDFIIVILRASTRNIIVTKFHCKLLW